MLNVLELKNQYNLKEKKNDKNSTELSFDYRVISTYDIPLIHAKIFVIDGKCAIMGSANFTENCFHNFAEYILITKEIDMVNRIERDFESFWSSCNSFKNQITTVNVRKILKNLKIAITGANGFVGNNLSNYLSQKGIEKQVIQEKLKDFEALLLMRERTKITANLVYNLKKTILYLFIWHSCLD